MLRKDLAPLDSYLADALCLDPAAFAARYSWPMLVIPEPTDDVLSRIRRPETIIEEDSAQTTMDPLSPKMLGASLSAICLELRPKGAATRREVVVGRSIECDVILIDESVSRRHATFSWDAECKETMLQDLGARNGTFVQDARLGPRQEMFLAPAAVVTFGSLLTRYYPPVAFQEWLCSGAPRSGASPGTWPTR